MLPFVLLAALQLAALAPAAALPRQHALPTDSVQTRRVPFWQRMQAETAQVAPEPEPEPEPEPIEEAISEEVVLDKANNNDVRHEYREDGDTTSISAGNQVIMYNGKPVVVDHKPVLQEAPTAAAGVQRRDLRRKLGLSFLDEEDSDEDAYANALDNPTVGFSGAFKQDFNNPGMSKDAIDASGPLREPPAPEPLKEPKEVTEKKAMDVVKETPIDISSVERAENVSGGSFILYNGKPMTAQNKPNDISRFIPNTLNKRDIGKRDVRKMMGMNSMFDGGKKKKAMLGGEEGHEVAAPMMEEAVDPEPEPEAEEIEEEEEDEENQIQVNLGDIKGGSFVVYNGVPVEVNGKITKKPQVKKPKFHKDDGDSFILDKRAFTINAAPGRTVKGLNPFASNPLSGSNNNDNDARNGKTLGDTFSESLVAQEFAASVGGSQEDEIVNVDVGENYVLYNGKPQRRIEGVPGNNVEIANLRDGFF